MWRDPLDELIDDLERAAPDPAAASGGMFPFLKLQALTDAILYGTEEQVARLKTDPEYQRWSQQRGEQRARAKTDEA